MKKVMKLGRLVSAIFCLALAISVTACGGGGGGKSAPPPVPSPLYTIGGNVSGLSGTLVLQINGGNSLTVNGNGAFTFTQRLTSGSAFSVTIATQPAGQTCAITAGNGTATGNITSVSIACTTPTNNNYTVGGSISGLVGTLVLQNNGGNNLTVTGNGVFTFTQSLNSGSAFSVTIAAQPAGQNCTVTTGSGTATSNITSVIIACTTPINNMYTVGGSISGLLGSLVLQNNGSNNLTVTNNGAFAFTQSLNSGASYSVGIASQPTGQNCVIVGGNGTATNNVTSVIITCANTGPSVYTIGGSVSGLKGPMVLQNNTSNDLIVTGNGTFTFTTPIAAGSTYGVTIASHSALQNCTVTSGNGTITSNVLNVAIICSDKAITATLTYLPVKIFHFAWSTVTGATHYRLQENADGNAEYVQAGTDLTGSVSSYDHVVPLYARVNASYIVQACDANICIGSNALTVTANQLSQAIGYFKSSNTDQDDHFGDSLALSADGTTLAVGNWGEDSNATGINGNQSDNSTASRGAVYVFTRIGLTWSQQAYIKPSNASNGLDTFGYAVALSADGNTLVVGAPGEASNATGINGNQTNKSAGGSGAVYVFTRSGITWTQQAYTKASNTDTGDQFGYSVALSANGNILIVGAPTEASQATGINGDQTDNTGRDNGAVYAFKRSGTNWTQQAYIKGSNTRQLNQFGYKVSLSGDGNTLAVASPFESSVTTGVNGNQTQGAVYGGGAVYIFVQASNIWTQQAYIKASNTTPDNTNAGDEFGWALALSADGNTLAVGAYKEDSNAVGTNGAQADNSATDSGAAYVFARNGATWSQQAYLKASNTHAHDYFGFSLSLSTDGNVLAVGAPFEGSNAIGINGDQANTAAVSSGAIYIFKRSSFLWQQAYVKASNTESGDVFGYVVTLSADGATLAATAISEDSSSTGVNGNQHIDPVTYFDSGAVYVY